MSSQGKFGLFDFSDYIEERTQWFTGRKWAFEGIEVWLAKENSSRYFLLSGEPGSGKSSVAGRLAQFSVGQATAPGTCPHLAPGFLTAVHFCRANASDTLDPRTFARSVALQLAKIEPFAKALLNVGDKAIIANAQVTASKVESGASVTGISIQTLQIQGLNGQEAFNRTVLGPLKAIYEAGFDQPIVILVDSMDEALSSNTEGTVVDLLSRLEGLDPHVRFILTSRPDPHVDTPFRAADGLSLSDPDRSADNTADINDFVTLRLAEDPAIRSKAAGITDAQGAAIAADIAAKADGNFQYVAFLLRAVAGGQLSIAKLTGFPPGLDGLYYDSLDRVVKLGKKDWTTEYKPFLGVLSVSLEPLPFDLVQQYAGARQSLWDVYGDLIQFVESRQVTRLGDEPDGQEDRYRIYHQSMVDFLHRRQLIQQNNGQTKTLVNNYYLESDDWQARIVDACAGPGGDWALVDWKSAAPYTLRHLAGHLFALSKNRDYRAKLHSLLGTRAFVDAHLAILGKPYLLLDDFRSALGIALADDDLAQAWRHILEYRRILREQLDFEKLRRAVESANENGDYLHVTERTGLYGMMPNSQALARLWIAWNAAACGHTDEATKLIKQAVDRLPARGIAQASSQQVGPVAVQEVEDAIGEALQRILVRIAQATGLAGPDRAGWLQEAITAWPPAAIHATLDQLDQPLSSASGLSSDDASLQNMEQVFAEVRGAGAQLGGDVPLGSAGGDVLFYPQRRLAAGLLANRHSPDWLSYVKRAVAMVSLDDYPSYREVALAWIAVAVLAQEEFSTAQQALAIVLGGVFRPGPGFWGDTVAAAMDGMGRESGQDSDTNALSDLLEHLEAASERGVDPNVDRKLPSIIQWRKRVGLPDDPWAFAMRRKSAIAAVIHRAGKVDEAEHVLQEAGELDHDASYAGYRALARLSVACRGLEWQKAWDPDGHCQAAADDALHVRDEVLRNERVELVGKMQTWLTQWGTNAAALTDDEAYTLLQQKSGLERGLFIEFLSAAWSSDAARLKKLLPLALDDATTADAVFGRLLGLEAAPARPNRPFLALVRALNIDQGMEAPERDEVAH